MAVSEEWRRIDFLDTERSFFASSLGGVKRGASTVSVPNGLTGRVNVRELPEHIFPTQDGRHGYQIVTLQLAPKKKRTLAVAPLICQTFHGPKPHPKMHCAHLNGDNQDNRPENLAWVEPAENEAHKALHGTRMNGERHHQAVLTEDQVRAIRASTASGVDIARQFGVSTTNVCDIRNRKIWQHI